MWSNEIRQNLAEELESKLDSKNFFNAKAYYARASNDTQNISLDKSVVSTQINKNYDYSTAVKGISFENKLKVERKKKTIHDLSSENMKIYKIADLVDSDLEETIVIPYNISKTSLALIKKFDWRDILFSNVDVALGMIKSNFRLK